MVRLTGYQAAYFTSSTFAIAGALETISARLKATPAEASGPERSWTAAGGGSMMDETSGVGSRIAWG